MEPIVHTVHEPSTGTWQYIVADPETKHALIIDSVLDFDSSKNAIGIESANVLLAKVAEEGYTVDAVLETHLHADHISASGYLCKVLKTKQSAAPKICIGSGISGMQKLFGERYRIAEEEWNGAFDRTYSDGETFPLGKLAVEVMHLPGHTPDHIGYMIGSNVFTGDSIFNPDLGSARCDFPEGSANSLWKTMQRLLALPLDYKLYTGHDYPPADRDSDEGIGKPRPYATVREHKQANKHVKEGTLEQSFVEMRTTRDAGLKEPRLMNQALQFNIRAGRLPEPGNGGNRWLYVPVSFPANIMAV